MGYIGNQQTEGYSQVPPKQDLTGATGTTLTLSNAVASAEGIDLFINNVRQEPTTAYSVGGDGVTVTLTGSVVATDDIYVVYNSLARQTSTHPSNQALQATSGTFSGTVTANAFSGNGSSLTGVGVAGISSSSTSGTAVSIDANNIVTKPYQPAFRAYLTGTTTQSSGLNLVAGTFLTSYNIGGHYNTSTKRFTAPIAGRYLFTATVATSGSQGSFSYLSCEFTVNGTRAFVGGWQGNSSPSYSKSVSTTVLDLNPNDYVELACEAPKSFAMEGGALSMTYMSGYLLG